MKHLRGYAFMAGTAMPIEMDVTHSQQAHQMLAAAGVTHYIFLIEREVEDDE